MVPAGNKVKRLSLVNHTTKIIHHEVLIKCSLFTGHVLIELFSPPFPLLKKNKDIALLEYHSGKRYREVELAAPDRYKAFTKKM